MRLKKFMVTGLATVLSVSMLGGCGNKKVTIDDIMKKNNDASIEAAKQIDTAIADSELTYDEYKSLFGLINEGTMDIAVTGVGKMTLAQDGITAEMSGNFNADMVMQIDADDMEFALTGEFGYGYEAMGTKDGESVELGVYLVKEEEGYYFYTQSGDEKAVREYVGDIEELFKEPLDLSEAMTEFEGKTFESMVQEQIDANPYKDKMVLLEETVQHNDKECYVIKMDLTWDDMKQMLETNEQFKLAMEETGTSFDEMLAVEITETMTMEDIFKCMTFKYQYYYAKDDLSLVYLDIDMIDMAKSLAEAITKALEAEEGIKIVPDISEFKMTCGYKEEAVDVKFEGEFVDADDYSGVEPEIFPSGTSSDVKPEITFEANANFGKDEMLAVKIGDVAGTVGVLTVEEFEKIGFTNYSGEAEKFDGGYFDGAADGYFISASEKDGVVDDISVMADDYVPSGTKLPKIDIAFTEYGIKLGDSVDVLAKLGEPAGVYEYSGEYSYEWEVITDDFWYFFDVTTENGVIIDISLYII